MSRCLCVNPQKKEFIDFEDLSVNACDGEAACNTAEYLLATEWKGDSVVFIYDGECISDKFDMDDIYEYIVDNYDERKIFNSVPTFRYIVNPTLKEYYEKSLLPMNFDDTYTSPLPFILTEKANEELVELKFKDEEQEQLGRWCNCSIFATNNPTEVVGYTPFVSSFIREQSSHQGLNGLNIVVTGHISGYSRWDVENIIRNNGGNPQSSVTKKTDFVVRGYKPGTTKLGAAADKGIKVIDQKEFFDMIKEE